MRGKPLRKKKKQAELPSEENYTIFHALFEAVKDKEKESSKPTSLRDRLKLRK